MSKLSVLHIIDSLRIGGAEALMASYIPKLTEYRHLLVTFDNCIEYKSLHGVYDHYVLDFRPSKLFSTARKLRRIIDKEHILVVHAHSYWTNILTRLATPNNCKLFNHYHFADYITRKTQWKVRFQLALDMIFVRKGLTRLAVSDYIFQGLKQFFPRGNNYLLYNFLIGNSVYEVGLIDPGKKPIRCIAIGTINKEKNYEMMLEIFKSFQPSEITIDVFGAGAVPEQYLNNPLAYSSVQFKGVHDQAAGTMGNYDLFCSFSNSESFGLVVLEAVAAGKALLLHKIPAFEEIAGDAALFFTTKEEFISRIDSIRKSGFMPDQNKYRSIISQYSIGSFLSKIRGLYQ
ncbi:MAG: glycosyltransferase [Bacteroidetes bacterium]|nr:glycosyltransferase [Bacteroidota bacterium]MBS1748057.1 glycosyltransferase [Bacteroidota bacterium]